MKKEIKYTILALSLIIFASVSLMAQGNNELLPTLNGEKAVETLKQNGQYTSLMEAVKTTRQENGQTKTTTTEDFAAQTAKLTASDGVTFDFLGGSVAVSGNTAIVGAYGEGPGNPPTGAAYVFVRSGTTWTEQQKLTPSDGLSGDNFGASVSISGDTAVVGAWGADVGTNFNQGAAYVYVRSGTVWTQQQKLTASDGAERNYFGVSVAIAGETIIAGAYSLENSGPNSRGAAYVLTRTGTTWTEQQKLLASDGVTDDNFGRSVAIEGDTAVVGAFGVNNDAGAAYVFVRSGTTWTEQQKLTASDGAAGDGFGGYGGVDISGNTIVVGAEQDDVGTNNNQGSAYVFVRSGTTWTQQQKLNTAEGGADDVFGRVGISGDTIVVGAQGKDFLNNNSNQGAAYVFVRSGTTWTEQQRLIASDGGQGDIFGISTAIEGNKIIIGAMFADIGSNSGQGAAYVFMSKVSVGGRVTTDDGRSVNNAIVRMTLANGTTLTARTSSFGYYRFDDVEADQTVNISVVSKQYQFTPQVVPVNGNLTNVDFTALP